jgi:MFS transporter, DHA1 family, multidrug resistance protein
LLNSRLSIKYGARRVIKWLLSIYTLMGGILLLFTLGTDDPPSMIFFFISIAVLLGINLAVEPNSSALALEPMGKTAGLASSIYGTSFFFVGAGLGSVISTLMSKGVLPLVIGFFVLGLLTLVLVFTDRRPSTHYSTKP